MTSRFEEYNLSEEEIKQDKKKSPLSELESHMLAEEELSSIFSNSKLQDSCN